MPQIYREAGANHVPPYTQYSDGYGCPVPWIILALPASCLSLLSLALDLTLLSTLAL